jgi:hypothetical protein
MGQPKKGNSPDLAPARARQVFRREGEYWTIVYAGTTVRLRDALGLHYVAYLLANPRQRVAAVELAAVVKGGNAGDGERARSAVSKRIRDAMRRIQAHHPTLGHHLAAALRTGAQCVYVPDPDAQLTWNE